VTTPTSILTSTGEKAGSKRTSAERLAGLNPLADRATAVINREKPHDKRDQMLYL